MSSVASTIGGFEIPHGSEEYAGQALEAYTALPESPKSLTERTSSFISQQSDRLLQTFERSDFLCKAAIITAGVGVTYLSYKVVKSVAGIVDSAFRGIFGIGKKAEKEKSETQSNTSRTVIGIVIGGVLATALLPQGIKKGLLDGVSKVFGYESFEKAQEQLASVGSTVHAGLTQVREGISEGTQALEKWYEGSKLKDITGQMKVYLDETYPGWAEWEEMRWIQDLADPQKILLAFGYTAQDFITHPEKIAGLGVSWLLLSRYMTKTGALLNVALLGFLMSDAPHSYLSNFLTEWEPAITASAAKIDRILSNFGLSLEDLELPPLSLENISIWLIDYIKGSPTLTAFTTLGSLHLSYHILSYVVLKLLSFLQNGLISLPKYAVKAVGAPVAAVTAVTGVALSYMERRKLIQDIADMYYSDIPEKSKELDLLREQSGDHSHEIEVLIQEIQDLEQGKQGFLSNFTEIFGIDFTHDETFWEKTLDPFYQRLLKAPTDLLSDPHFRIELRRRVEAGELTIRFPSFVTETTVGSTVSIGLGLLQAGSYAWHTLNVSIGAWEAFFAELGNLFDSDDFNIYACTVLGLEGFVFGKASLIGGYKGYKSLLEVTEHGWRGGFSRLATSFIPLHPNNRHIFFSILREAGDTVTKGQFTSISRAMRVADVTFYARQIAEILQNPTQESMEKLSTLQRRLSSMLGDQKYKYLDELEELRSHFDDLKALNNDVASQVTDFIRQKKNLALLDRSSLARLSTDITEHIFGMESLYSRFLGVYAHLVRPLPQVRQAYNVLRGQSGASASPRLEASQLFRKSPAEFGRHFDELERIVPTLSDTDPRKLLMVKELEAMRAFQNAEVYALGTTKILDPATLSLDIAAFSSSSEKVSRIKLLAGQIEGREKGLYEYFTREVERIIADAHARGLPLNSPQVTTELQGLDSLIIRPFARQKAIVLKALHEEVNKLPKGLRPLLKSSLRLAAENQYSMLTRFTKAANGRLKLMFVVAGLMFATERAIDQDEVDHDFGELVTEFLADRDLWQLLLELTPFIGTGALLYSVATGKEVLGQETTETGELRARTLTGSERGLNAVWATVSLFGDLASVVSLGAATSATVLTKLAKLAVGTGRSARAAKRLLALWPRIANIAERSGGWGNFMKKFVDKMGKGSKERALLKTFRTVEYSAMAVGTAYIAGTSVKLLYGVLDEDIPDIDVASDQPETASELPLAA